MPENAFHNDVLLIQMGSLVQMYVRKIVKEIKIGVTPCVAFLSEFSQKSRTFFNFYHNFLDFTHRSVIP